MIRRLWRENRGGRTGLAILAGLAFSALFGDFLATDRPLFCVFDGKTYWPALRGAAVDLGLTKWPEPFLTENWRDLRFEKTVLAPIPYAATNLDSKNTNCRSPFGFQDVPSKRYRHWLGTDSQGRDVAAGLIRGARVALTVGVVAVSISAFLGILLGGLAGYFGDNRLRWSRIRLIVNSLCAFAALFWGLIARSFWLDSGLEWLKSAALAAVIFWAGNLLSKKLEAASPSFLKKKLTIPADLIIMRLAEVFNGIPRLILFFAVAAILSKPSLGTIVAIIGAVGWTGIARFTRAEMLRIRELGYIENARMLGFPDWKILRRHAMPNALGPVLVALTFGVGNAILLEAFLSFLGIGVSGDVVTWGSMLNEGRNHFEAPWLVVLPGLMLFLTTFAFNLLGEAAGQVLNNLLGVAGGLVFKPIPVYRGRCWRPPKQRPQVIDYQQGKSPCLPTSSKNTPTSSSTTASVCGRATR